MTKLREIAAMAAVVLTATLGGFEARAQPVAPVEAHNVVLVHGAWADGSSWAAVIPRLQAAGLNVFAVQNPLTSLEDSVAATRRALALQDGPTVLVAHSWGGTVISEEGTDPKVTALVYVAARAPAAGEDFVALSGKFPVGPARAGIQVHDGFTALSEESFLKYFANGVEPKRADVLYAVQEPTAASLFGERTTAAAWHSKPSWYAVSKLDQTINPDLERFLAKRMNATTVELEAGHPSLVSHPREIADLILAAAGRKKIRARDSWRVVELAPPATQEEHRIGRHAALAKGDDAMIKISAKSGVITLTNVFIVEPANQQRLIELLTEATEVAHILRPSREGVGCIIAPRASVEAQQRAIAHEIVKNRRLAHKIVQMAERVSVNSL